MKAPTDNAEPLWLTGLRYDAEYEIEASVDIVAHIDTLAAKLERAEKVIRFYADEKSYQYVGVTMPEGYTKPIQNPPIDSDKGQRAREYFQQKDGTL